MTKKIKYVSPINGKELLLKNNIYETEKSDEVYKIINNIPRFCKNDNYAKSFGYQWKIFNKTQLDVVNNFNQSEKRLFLETNWDKDNLHMMNILEVGSGAGRFTEVLLRTTTANIYSVDYSNAVEANYENNKSDRLNLAQASIYNLPYLDKSFDKVLCLGVLQHTPNFCNSIKSLIEKTKIGGEIVVDFYSINGWYTKIHSKYLIRSLLKNKNFDFLFKKIESNIDVLIFLFDLLCKLKLGLLTRFLPVTDLRNFPTNLTKEQRREWAILDTIDGFSPEYDQPEKISTVKKYFECNGCNVEFANHVMVENSKVAVVRAIREI